MINGDRPSNIAFPVKLTQLAIALSEGQKQFPCTSWSDCASSLVILDCNLN
jgi:hypothetical protein